MWTPTFGSTKRMPILLSWLQALLRGSLPSSSSVRQIQYIAMRPQTPAQLQQEAGRLLLRKPGKGSPCWVPRM